MKGILKVNDIINLEVNQFIDLVTPLLASSQPTEIPSLMLWGPPGIGKSVGVKTVGRKLKEMTGKKVNITDVRLLLFNPIDLRGIPVADANRELAKWLKPQIFQMDESSDTINILFLDEISSAPLSVQAASYQITLDRVIGEHKLPDNCFVIAAGNRIGDKGVSYAMPKPLANRLSHLEIVCGVEDWKKWAIPAGIDSRIIGFLNYKNSALFQFNPSNDDVAYPTPRSWEMVDKYLKKMELEKAFPLIAGSVGAGAAVEFKAYTNVYEMLPDVQGILNGKVKKVPKRPDILYALSASLAESSHKANSHQLANLLRYMNEMTAEFSTLTMQDILTVKETKNKILVMPEWDSWFDKHKGFIM